MSEHMEKLYDSHTLRVERFWGGVAVHDHSESYEFIHLIAWQHVHDHQPSHQLSTVSQLQCDDTNTSGSPLQPSSRSRSYKPTVYRAPWLCNCAETSINGSCKPPPSIRKVCVICDKGGKSRSVKSQKMRKKMTISKKRSPRRERPPLRIPSTRSTQTCHDSSYEKKKLATAARPNVRGKSREKLSRQNV